MASRRTSSASEKRRRKPPTTPEAQEQELIGLAIDVAEEQLRNGTASSQVITHFLRLASTREQLEQERLRHENELTRVKIQGAESLRRVEELYVDAIDAMRSYRGDALASEGEEDAA